MMLELKDENEIEKAREILRILESKIKNDILKGKSLNLSFKGLHTF
jgi:hypothetical protein